MGPDLTQGEIDAICEPLKQAAAQIRYLRSLGLMVARKPNGHALVNRKHYDDVRGRPPATAKAPKDNSREREEPAWRAT